MRHRPATSPAPRPALVWAALGTVYLVWGWTYLAIPGSPCRLPGPAAVPDGRDAIPRRGWRALRRDGAAGRPCPGPAGAGAVARDGDHRRRAPARRQRRRGVGRAAHSLGGGGVAR